MDVGNVASTINAPWSAAGTGSVVTAVTEASTPQENQAPPTPGCGKAANHGKDLAIAEANGRLEVLGFHQFVEDCYRETARRVSVFDPALLQPRLLPAVADLAASGLRI